jgi:hypothetical protein
MILLQWSSSSLQSPEDGKAGGFNRLGDVLELTVTRSGLLCLKSTGVAVESQKPGVII